MGEKQSPAPYGGFLEGWLEKRGGSKGGRRNWQKRYFVLTDEMVAYFTPKGELKGHIPLVFVTEVKNSPVKSRENCFSIEYDCTEMSKKDKTKKGVREIPIDCGDMNTKSRWIKYVDTIVKIYKLQHGNNMFTEYQTAVSERTLNIMKMGAQFFTNNHEFMKRLINENTKREWNEVVTPLLDALFNTLAEFVSAARDGTVKTTEAMNALLSPLEKMIGGIISRWGRLNDKGHGNEVDKMAPNLEALESAVHRMENVVVKFITDENERIKQEGIAKEKEKERLEQLKKQQEEQREELKKQREELARNPPPKPYNPLEDPNLSEFEKEVYRQKDKFGDVDELKDDDPNSNILKSLLDLQNLK